MPKLTLGTHMLPPGEVVLIRTIMRIFSHDHAFGWKFCDHGPYDALIMDSATTAAQGPETAAGAVLRLTPGHAAPSGDTLQRPIKAEKLQGWLKNLALELLGRHAAAPAPGTGAHLLAMKQARFKLLRWPSSALLQNDASLIRMSSLLSRRALQLSELAELSHQSIECCFAFIEKLLPMKMVTCEFMAPLASAPASCALMPPTPARRPAAAPAPARIPFHQSLISKIRQHLGI
jgi:hypothetical protein